MKSTDDFHSIILLLNEQLHCRRAYTLPIYEPQEDAAITPQQVSLKNITIRVNNYVKQHRVLSIETKQEALREVSMVRIRFAEVLKNDEIVPRGLIKRINYAIYRSILNWSVVKNIEKTFSGLPAAVEFHLELKTTLNTKKSNSATELLNTDEKDLAHSIAEYLKKPIERFHLRYNPFSYDVHDAIEYSLTKNQGILSAFYIKEFLLKALEEKYSSIEERFTESQVHDVEAELKLAQHYAFLREHYEHNYSEYDDKSLREAVKASHLPVESGKPDFYSVLHHRMPGTGATHVDYEHLRQAVITLMSDPETIKYIEKHSIDAVKSPTGIEVSSTPLISLNHPKSPKVAKTP